MKQAFLIVILSLLLAECSGFLGDEDPYGDPKGHCVFDFDTGMVNNCTCPTGEIPLTEGDNQQICGPSPCDTDSDCPPPPEGVTAVPECLAARMPTACQLSCTSQEDCGSEAICTNGGSCSYIH
ncbi:hypothetical protein FOL47_003432 [Perkinsus chesapeaki]|uniref:Uncharacterized protein n=1 Tax=Perkinsus chesapeaki TaxID=330153 RepID=A0A7J6KP12_PERCH|nr:hypothetical protein FOL47_003432 [Perkinsus chesapeaki]